jgi:hypothetical protein
MSNERQERRHPFTAVGVVGVALVVVVVVVVVVTPALALINVARSSSNGIR